MQTVSTPTAPVFGEPPARNTIQVQISLATPMLGGGATPGKPDLHQPFRPSSIRGALRRWWRASHAFASPSELREREMALWGGSIGGDMKPSQVIVEVDLPARSNLQSVNVADCRAPKYAYGLFAKEAANLFVLEKAQVSLRVTVFDPQLVEEVRRALRSWIEFGGLGARTRRGFGALQCDDVAGMPAPERGPLPQALRKSGFTSLLGARLYLKPAADANSNAAWHDALKALESFRKGQLASNPRPTSGAESHSPWPEADSIRQLQRRIALDSSNADKSRFPRAELGLPLEFRSAPRSGDFDKANVLGTDSQDRLASPVICKPIYRNGRWHSAVLLMARGRYKPDLTDCSGYPTNIYGWPKYSGDIQKHSDILDVLSLVLKKYEFVEAPL